MANEIKGFLILVIGICCLIYVLRILKKKITQHSIVHKFYDYIKLSYNIFVFYKNYGINIIYI